MGAARHTGPVPPGPSSYDVAGTRLRGEEPLEEAAGLSLSAADDLIYEIRRSRLRHAAPETVVAGVRVVGFSTGERSLGGIECGIPAVLATQHARAT